MKLMKFEHPYYMSEGCYFSGDCHTNYSNFDRFLEEYGDADIDYNRVHRWDIEEDGGVLTLKVYFVIQRKGYTTSAHIRVKHEDESRIKDFLKPHAILNAKLWEGIL